MTQNVYDDERFFSAYSQLDRSRRGLPGAPEWPALRAMLPELAGLRVLDLGCGFGWFARWAAEAGGASVLGLDISERMLDRARAATTSANITYRRADLETVELPKSSFELAFSSLAFHYVVELGALFERVGRSLVRGGKLVFSMEHPIYMAPSRPAFLIDPDGTRTWPLDRYSEEGPRTTDWLAPGVVKQHRTIGTILNLLIGAGFAIRHVEEWSPNDDLLAQRPDLADERTRPMFLLVAADH
ncbi:MAG: class I SAM-dependent methyltransferase [Vicinamibacteria bacterium]|nr:class I SAM-dependent methyltransferase [Vicinamibacteria bacterium]